jgi:hypothetical protein
LRNAISTAKATKGAKVRQGEIFAKLGVLCALGGDPTLAQQELVYSTGALPMSSTKLLRLVDYTTGKVT